jgi:hypothetical protein
MQPPVHNFKFDISVTSSFALYPFKEILMPIATLLSGKRYKRSAVTVVEALHWVHNFN